MEAMPPPLKGEVPVPVNPPPGCRLEPRCPIRVDKCKSIEPRLEEKAKSHQAACHEVGRVETVERPG
jgi:oligopeptide/dipeptide ABC transporter ATP-binding protein